MAYVVLDVYGRFVLQQQLYDRLAILLRCYVQCCITILQNTYNTITKVNV